MIEYCPNNHKKVGTKNMEVQTPGTKHCRWITWLKFPIKPKTDHSVAFTEVETLDFTTLPESYHLQETLTKQPHYRVK